MKYFKKKRITLIKQYLHILNNYKDIITEHKFSKGVMNFKLHLKPLDSSYEYDVLLEQKQNLSPKIFIINPNIYVLTNGCKPPHVYEFNKEKCRICLFLPNELNLGKYVDVVIPWISDWLAHFEIWMITGNWHGGGHEFEKNIREI